jgi:filamentous hemagglutinin
MKEYNSGLGDIGKDPTLESTIYENTLNEINNNLISKGYVNTFYDDKSKTAHIFAKRKGHLVDTPQNRATLLRIANDETLYRGTDIWGNKWYIESCGNGGQHWVRVRNGKINEGGYNRTPIKWNSQTGLYKSVQIKNPLEG